MTIIKVVMVTKEDIYLNYFLKLLLCKIDYGQCRGPRLRHLGAGSLESPV